MKKYEKPTLEVVQIRVKEDIANNGDGNTTGYLIDGTDYVAMGFNEMGDLPS